MGLRVFEFVKYLNTLFYSCQNFCISVHCQIKWKRLPFSLLTFNTNIKYSAVKCVILVLIMLYFTVVRLKQNKKSDSNSLPGGKSASEKQRQKRGSWGGKA